MKLYRSVTRLKSDAVGQAALAATIALAMILITGCTAQRNSALKFTPDTTPCQAVLQEIEYPDLIDESCTDGSELLAGEPVTISNYQELSLIHI